MNIDTKILSKILAKRSQHVKKSTHHYQAGFIPWVQGRFTICKLISIIQHTNMIKDKNDMIFDAERSQMMQKDFNKIQAPLMIKAPKKLDIK